MKHLLLATALAGALCLAGAGCTGRDAPIPVEPGTFVVPGDFAWVSTGLTVERGRGMIIEESAPGSRVLVDGSRRQAVGARGTYLFDAESRPYPLEPGRAHDDRRYPAYCLIGRIAPDGAPFHVGSRFQGPAPDSGELLLGINDPSPRRNRGAFHCRISVEEPGPVAPGPGSEPQSGPEPASHQETPKPAPPSEDEPLATRRQPGPRPVPDANVVILFVDGLRPDVVVEMARWGHMPNFNGLFLEGGAWVRNSFTVQPSLTLTSYASIVTGLYANHHGVKMQCYPDTATGAFVEGTGPRDFLRFADEVGKRGVLTVYDRFSGRFGSGALPFKPLRADIMELNMVEWLHRGINTANYASAIRTRMDEVQTRFALDLASSPKVRVMLVWLPRTDSSSEHTPHGQFGGTRATVARVDECIGKIVAQLKARRRFERTYFILASDHGHSGGEGGEETVNRRFDVERELFHAHLHMNVRSMWHRFDFPGAPAARLGYVSDSDGAVGIFLPRRHVDSGDFSAPGDFAELADYELADGRRVNAVELFAEHSALGRRRAKGGSDWPVDFAVVRVDADTVLLHRTAGCQALIHARRAADGTLEFQYRPVRDFAPGRESEPVASGDPLGYLDNAAFRAAVGDASAWIGAHHDGREWLRATCDTEYPACVDTLNLYFRWDGPVDAGSPVPPQPSILLFAAKGWAFEPKQKLGDRDAPGIGSRHGMAFREATNHSLFISGPGIRRGAVVTAPHRIVDIMPTVLEMMGRDPAGSGMDGRPIREIWEDRP